MCGRFERAFAGVYEPNDDVERCLWDELVGLTSEMEALWKKVVDIKFDSMKGVWRSKEVGGPMVWECGNV